ncbi:Organic solute transporter subunit alpha/Transmembrane protein 184 [Dillenia turbinata]|uniref:Organic solute transporter subunit alpha/Transmembrane protein 184 n=1 Tax=Dillenia turbinata TaxID=194707 RepID=A0AAN8ZKW0_9MAGN
MKPLAKFISFKAIVNATSWQGIGIALLCAFGVLPSEGKIGTGLQDLLICIEAVNLSLIYMFL